MRSSVADDADALPEPPVDIATRKLPLVERPPGTRYVRIHRAADGPVWFGWNPGAGQFRPPTNRFDAPDRSFGVLYAAVTRDGSFAETVGRKPDTFRANDELSGLAMTTLALTKALRLVDLHGGAAVGALGATGVVGVGPQSLARRWSKVLHAHPEMPDGIEYRCRHNSDEIAVALFDRVEEASLVSIGVVSLVSDLVWLNAMRVRHHILEPPT